MGRMYFLPRRIGLSKAKELIFTGRKVEIDEAAKLGIVDRKTSGTRCWRMTWLGWRVGQGIGHGAGADQDHHQPELRVVGA